MTVAACSPPSTSKKTSRSIDIADTIGSAGVRAISRRFQLALAWLGTGTLLGALLPALGVAVIAAFILYYWLPISGELGREPHPQRRV
jgi:hypothetical protein